MLLPALARAKRSRPHATCVNNLKQLSLGFQFWANDNQGKLPMQVSTNEGGSLEWTGTKEVYRHFVVASNEIASPKVLVCHAEPVYQPARFFSDLHNENISYFLNLSAIETNDHPQLLSGDRNLTQNGIQYTNGSYLISTQQTLAWGNKLHKNTGNISLTDGSVQQTSDQKLQSLISQLGPPTNWLAFP
jgi:hypothetical protein